MEEEGKLGRGPRHLADRELRPLCESIIDLPSQSAECSCMNEPGQEQAESHQSNWKKIINSKSLILEVVCYTAIIN